MLLDCLPNLVVPSRQNQIWTESGIDSLTHCVDRQHYLNYPWPIEYRYNNRGFRDSPWPDNLDSVVWCIGDSFTVGLGCPVSHTWPWLLQEKIGRRTVNVSMDGASNAWISRTASEILSEFPSATIVVQWSYVHRSEMTVEQAKQIKFKKFYKQVQDPSWPEANDITELPLHIQQELLTMHGWNGVYAEDRLLHCVGTTSQQDVEATQHCINQLGNRVIQSAIPGWLPASCNIEFPGIIQLPQLDRSRDGHHYDQATAQWFVQNLNLI